jgi:hypothetical protein
LTSRTRPHHLDPYATLGVDRYASASDIKAAYRSRIRTAHPDVNGGNEDTAVLLNEAYSILSDPAKKAAYDRGTVPTRDVEDETLVCPECSVNVPIHLVNAHWRTHLIEQHGPLCVACGRYPTRPLRLKSHSGFLLWRTSSELNESFCRSCGKGVFREVQARNITRGPWGIISFFATIMALFGNTGRYSTFKTGTDSPTPPHPVSESVLEGRGVLRRPSVLVVLGIVIAAAALVISNASQPSYTGSSSPGYTPPPVTSSVDFTAGTCVAIEDGWVSALPTCGGADGVVESVVSDPSDCSFSSDSYIERDGGGYACLLEY